jgi:hypothetical protein
LIAIFQRHHIWHIPFRPEVFSGWQRLIYSLWVLCMWCTAFSWNRKNSVTYFKAFWINLGSQTAFIVELALEKFKQLKIMLIWN